MVVLAINFLFAVTLAPQCEDIVVQRDRDVFGVNPRQLCLDRDVVVILDDVDRRSPNGTRTAFVSPEIVAAKQSIQAVRDSAELSEQGVCSHKSHGLPPSIDQSYSQHFQIQ